MPETFARQVISARFKVINNRRSRQPANDRKPPSPPLLDQKTEEANARLALMTALGKFAEPAGDVDYSEALTPFNAFPPVPPPLTAEMLGPHAIARQSPRATESPPRNSKTVTGKARGRDNHFRSRTETKRSSRQKEKASILKKSLSSVTVGCETVIYVFLRILLWPVDIVLALDRRTKGTLVFIGLVGLAVLSLPAPVEQLSHTQPKHSATPVATPNSTPRKQVNVNGSKNKKGWKKKPSAARNPEF